MATLITALLGFGIPAIISHFAVASTAATVLGGVVGTGAATAIAGAGSKAAGGLIARQIGQLLGHIANGGEVTAEHREWLRSQQGVAWTAPKLDPGQQPQGPVTWTTPKV